MAVGFDMQAIDVSDGFMNIFSRSDGDARFYSFTSSETVGQFAQDPRAGFASAMQDTEPMKWSVEDSVS